MRSIDWGAMTRISSGVKFDLAGIARNKAVSYDMLPGDAFTKLGLADWFSTHMKRFSADTTQFQEIYISKGFLLSKDNTNTPAPTKTRLLNVPSLFMKCLDRFFYNNVFQNLMVGDEYDY